MCPAMEVFEAIAQPTRRQILRLLADGERSAGDVAAQFSVTQPAISQHLKVLRECGLISERREGTRRLLSLRTEGLDGVNEFLAEILPGGLQRLKRAAEREERRAEHGRRAARN